MIKCSLVGNMVLRTLLLRHRRRGNFGLTMYEYYTMLIWIWLLHVVVPSVLKQLRPRGRNDTNDLTSSTVHNKYAPVHFASRMRTILYSKYGSVQKDSLKFPNMLHHFWLAHWKHCIRCDHQKWTTGTWRHRKGDHTHQVIRSCHLLIVNMMS